MKLFIVVLCYRVVDLTIDCLHSLSTEIGRVPGAKVGLLENGTGGDAGERLKKVIDENGWNAWVDLTVVYPNLGFTGGNNLLIRPMLESTDPPDYVLLLNSDTVVKERALDTLVEFMESHPAAGIAGSKMLWPDGEVRASPFRFPGVITELDGGLRLGLVSEAVFALVPRATKTYSQRQSRLGFRSEHDHPPQRARGDRTPGRGTLHLFRRCGYLPESKKSRLGNLVRRWQ